ncbi:hypothetical protein AMTR_s00179p00038920 [Amborella trichopoda]|uniref:Uncharacterized protein n=1 Tax=Amborella trichopoda TaxID=13333 RepID=W1PXU8_AMBTC|nr:hypothetical protein AMTR_s00179p00038920 [Amborella trichopoda]
MKILRIPTSMMPVSMLANNRVGTKVLHIPTTPPKTEMAPTREPAAGLNFLQISTSLREESGTVALHACCPTNRLKVLQIPGVLCIERSESDLHPLCYTDNVQARFTGSPSQPHISLWQKPAFVAKEHDLSRSDQAEMVKQERIKVEEGPPEIHPRPLTRVRF